MKQRPLIVVGIVAALLVTAAWFILLYSPKVKEVTDKESEITKAESEYSTLQSQLRQLEDTKKTEPIIDANLARVKGMIPENPELAEFVREADRIAEAAGLDWLQVSSANPVANGAYASTQLQMQLNGTFFEVIDYLVALQQMSRTVTCSSMQLSPSIDDETSKVVIAVTLGCEMYSIGDKIPNGPVDEVPATANPAVDPSTDSAATQDTEDAA